MQFNVPIFRSIVAAATLAATPGAALASSVEVGVAWQGQSGMARAVLEGAQARLAEIAPDVSLEIRGELDSIDELHSVATEFQNSGVDGMIILRSSGSVYLSENPPSVPTFIGGNNHPVRLGAVDSLEAPSGNVTGVTYYIDLEGPLTSFMALAPQVSSFLLVSQTGYSSSAIDGEGTMAACESLGLSCKQVFATGADEVAAVVADEIGAFDAVILGNQAAVFEHAQAALGAAGGKPVFSYAAKGVQNGALGGVIADDNALGAMLADSLVDVLVNGKPVSEVGIKMDPEPLLYINMTTAMQLGLEPPIEYLSIAQIIE